MDGLPFCPSEFESLAAPGRDGRYEKGTRFLETIVRKALPFLDDGAIACIRDAYGVTRRKSWDFHLDRQHGFRAFLAVNNPLHGEILFAGVHDDGRLVQGIAEGSTARAIAAEANGDIGSATSILAEIVATDRILDVQSRLNARRRWIRPCPFARLNYEITQVLYAPLVSTATTAVKAAVYRQQKDSLRAEIERLLGRALSGDGDSIQALMRRLAARPADVEQRLDEDPDRLLHEWLGHDRRIRRTSKLIDLVIWKRELERCMIRSRRLAAALDPETLHIMRGTGLYDDDVACWLAGSASVFAGGHADGVDVWVAPDAQRGMRRRQFARLFPVVLHEIVNDVRAPRPAPVGGHGETMTFLPVPASPFAAVGHAVDAGAEVVPVLARGLGVSKGTVRWLRGLTWQRAGRRIVPGLTVAAEALDALPVEWRPRNRKEWRSFWATLDQVREYQRGELTGHAAVESCRRDWRRLGALLDHARVTDISDVDRAIRTKLLCALIARRGLQQGLSWAEAAGKATAQSNRIELAKFAGQRRGIVQDLIWAMQCHEAERRIAGRIRNLAETDAVARMDASACKQPRWTPLVGTIRLGPLVIEELTSAQALIDEGSSYRMDHCVGGYVSYVLAGRSLIFSVRKNDRSLSTMEIGLHENAHNEIVVRVEQHRGWRNGPPPEECRPAEAVVAGSIRKCGRNRVATYLSDVRAVGWSRVSAHIEVTPLDVAALDIRFEALRPHLPKWARSLDLEEWGTRVLGWGPSDRIPEQGMPIGLAEHHNYALHRQWALRNGVIRQPEWGERELGDDRGDEDGQLPF